MKRIYLLLILLMPLFVETVYAAEFPKSKSNEFFNCSGSANQCISCTYQVSKNKVVYYVKADGNGGANVAYETFLVDNTDYMYSTISAKIPSAGYNRFCQGDNTCERLVCPQSINYSFNSKNGATTFDFDNQDSTYGGKASLSSSSDNAKDFISKETEKAIENGSKYKPNSCTYNTTYQTRKSTASINQNSFTVLMDADGNFTLKYKEGDIKNSTYLISLLNPKDFNDSACPTLNISCYGSSTAGYNCAFSDEAPSNAPGYDNSGKNTNNTGIIKEEKTNVSGDGIDSSFLKICDKNENPEILAVFRLAGILLMIVKIVVPLLLILFGMIDLSKAVIDSKDDAIKTSAIKFGKRVALGLIIFFVPSIISGLFTILTDYSSFIKEFEPCMNCILNPNGNECPKTSFTK